MPEWTFYSKFLPTGRIKNERPRYHDLKLYVQQATEKLGAGRHPVSGPVGHRANNPTPNFVF